MSDGNKFAVFCALDGQDIFDGFCNHFVMVFESKGAAVEWCADQLAENHPFIKRLGHGFAWSFEAAQGYEFHDSAERLLKAFQDQLAPAEYFHVFPVRDPADKAATCPEQN